MIYIKTFKADTKYSKLINYHKTIATELAQQNGSALSTLLIFKPNCLPNNISSKPHNPWMTSNISVPNGHSRYLERVWCRNSTLLSRLRLTKWTKVFNMQVSKAKSAHYSEIVAEHSGDHRSLWETFNKILHRCYQMQLPHTLRLLTH